MTELGSAFSTACEKYVIYGSINILGYGNHLAAWSWRKLKSGKVHHYAAILVAGCFVLVRAILLWWTGSSARGTVSKGGGGRAGPLCSRTAQTQTVCWCGG